MLTKKKIAAFLVFGWCLSGACALMAQDDTVDPVLQFYCQRAAGQAEARNPIAAGVTYSLHLRAYRYKYGRRGKTELTDSAAYINFYSFGKLDSQKVVYSTNKDLLKADLTYPNVFEGDYIFHFYPNDTGGEALPLGFDSESANTTAPLGLAVINRTDYYLLRLYLYYPNKKLYRRYSRELVFEDVQGYTIPDTILTNYALAGLLSVDYYRTEIVVDSVHITR